MRERITRILIRLAFALILADLVLVLIRIYPYFLQMAQRCPEASILAIALLFLTVAMVIRHPKQQNAGAHQRETER
jgi:hypothetical protein